MSESVPQALAMVPAAQAEHRRLIAELRSPEEVWARSYTQNVIGRSDLTTPKIDETTPDDTLLKIERAIREHGLVGDIDFDPPLTPEERRQRGVGIPIEERIE